MSTPFDRVKDLLRPGQSITLEPGSPIHKGPYQSKVFDLSGDKIRVGVPLDEGKLVLLPVGTRVSVKAKVGKDNHSLDMEIVMRTGGKERSLFLSPAQAEVAPEEFSQIVHRTTVRRVQQPIPAIAISSGKGGVGKSTLTVNLAVALSKLGRKVCIIDGDLGTANVDVLFNLSPTYNLAHVIRGEKHMLEVVVEGPDGLILLPGGSGFQELTTLSDSDFDILLGQFQQLEEYADLILIDTGSGLSPSVTNFLRSASDTILVTTPEPHAITDCYALIKVLANFDRIPRLNLVINRVSGDREGKQVSQKMTFASKKFLETDVNPLGYIHEDPAMIRSIRKQKPVLLEDPRARSAVQIEKIAQLLVSDNHQLSRPDGNNNFLERMRSLFWKKSPSP